MTSIQQQLMECLRAYRCGKMARAMALTDQEWAGLYDLAATHKLISVVHETLRTDPNFCTGNAALAARWKRDTIIQSMNQAAKTRKLLQITTAFETANIPYAVVKGAICRIMYQKPDLRQSGDEDLFIPEKFRHSASNILEELGFQRFEGAESTVDHWQEGRIGLHVELHRELFSTGWTAETTLNPLLQAALDQSVPTEVEGQQVMTLPPTEHFIFLIAHTMKHFITGGFGARTLCDVVTFAEIYAADIDKKQVYDILDQIRGKVFFQSLLAIGREYLDYDPAGWDLPDEMDFISLLSDMMDAGIYGQSTKDRKHSGAVILQAAQGNKPSLRKSLFPSAEALTRRYPVLQKAPYLLPIMWLRRIGGYAVEVMKNRGTSSPTGAIALSQQRLELMRTYGILP